jgi:hypothetical protein
MNAAVAEDQNQSVGHSARETRERLLAARPPQPFQYHLALETKVDFRYHSSIGECRTAAAVRDRVGAVASLHGGGLVTDAANSPHLQAAKTKAQFLIAIAADDDARSPNDKTALKETFAKVNLPAEIEV